MHTCKFYRTVFAFWLSVPKVRGDGTEFQLRCLTIKKTRKKMGKGGGGERRGQSANTAAMMMALVRENCWRRQQSSQKCGKPQSD